MKLLIYPLFVCVFVNYFFNSYPLRLSLCCFQILAEASKKIFSSVKSKIGDFVIDNDLDVNDCVRETKRIDNKCPEWIKVLEPIRRQPTNVGARIRNRVFKSLEKDPPEWAKEMLLRSISKDVYKGNASGPTKVRAF